MRPVGGKGVVVRRCTGGLKQQRVLQDFGKTVKHASLFVNSVGGSSFTAIPALR